MTTFYIIGSIISVLLILLKKYLDISNQAKINSPQVVRITLNDIVIWTSYVFISFVASWVGALVNFIVIMTVHHDLVVYQYGKSDIKAIKLKDRRISGRSNPPPPTETRLYPPPLAPPEPKK